MTKPTKEEQKAAHDATLAKAMSYEWKDTNGFMNAIACFYAFENMGQSIESRHTRGVSDDRARLIFEHAWNEHVQEAGYESGEDGESLDITAEHKSWLKTAKKIVTALYKHKMDYTMANAEKVFNDPKTYGKV